MGGASLSIFADAMTSVMRASAFTLLLLPAKKHARIQRRYAAQGRAMSKSKQRKLDRERYRMARKLWTEFMDGIIQEARSAAKVGNMAGIYQAIRRIPKRSSFNSS